MFTHYFSTGICVPPSPLSPIPPYISTPLLPYEETSLSTMGHDISSLTVASKRVDGGASSSHRPSNATSTMEMGTDNAHSDSDHQHVHSTATSATHTDTISTWHSSQVPDSESGDKDKKLKKQKKGEASEVNGKTTHRIELEQDAAIDPTPFTFRPYEPTHMLDPKNLDMLASFGGVAGLLRGLNGS